MQATDNQNRQSLSKQARQAQHNETEIVLFSNHSAYLIEEWMEDSEEETWKQRETQQYPQKWQI